MTAESEIAIAQLTRKRGIPFMVGLFWGFVTDDGRFTLACFWMFLQYNYSIFFCYAGYLLGIEEFWILGIAWLATVMFGTVRYVGWLIWLLFRWPPLARN